MEDDDQISVRIERYIAEMHERYERINRMWADTDLPAVVRQTPNWEDGWRVVIAWVAREQGLPPPTRDQSFRPRRDTNWAREIHIWAHFLHALPGGGGGGHTTRHAELEEEGTRLVLDWWRGRQGK
jgi:hypothetical protein